MLAVDKCVHLWYRMGVHKGLGWWGRRVVAHLISLAAFCGPNVPPISVMEEVAHVRLVIRRVPGVQIRMLD